jgi:hypothetical protein
VLEEKGDFVSAGQPYLSFSIGFTERMSNQIVILQRLQDVFLGLPKVMFA